VHGHGGGAMGVVEVVNCGKRRSLGVQEWKRKKKPVENVYKGYSKKVI
jgi:hypothetical protein